MRVTSVVVTALLCLPALASAQALSPEAAPTPHDAERAPSASATLTFARGPVEVSTGAGPSADRPARPGEALARGSLVRVGDAGYAEVTFSNGAVLALSERTQLMLFAAPTTAPGQAPSSTTTLLRGTARATTGPASGSPIAISTGPATVYVGRADAVVSVDASRATRVSVHRGRMRVRATGRDYTLSAGDGAREEFGRAPTRHALPAQAVWVSPPPASVPSAGAPVAVSATYGLPAGAARTDGWRVQVARDAAFRDVVSEARAHGPTTRWEAASLAPGAYFVRVAAVDHDRLEGVPSAAARVQVEEPRVVAGQRASGGSPGRVASVHVPRGALCGLDGARLLPTEGDMRLSPGRAHQLRCAMRADGQDAHAMAIAPEQAGPLVHEVELRTLSSDEGAVGVRLYDAEGLVVPYAEVTATADRGVTVEALRESSVRGVYNASVRWPRGVARARFRFTVNGTEIFEEDLSQDR